MEEYKTNEHEEAGLSVLTEKTAYTDTVIGQSASPLQQILLENIKKVQENPDYLPQAKEIRDQVSQMINLARVQVDAIRELRKMK